MKWFGESWGAPVCEDETHIEIPVGESCGYCDEPIAEGDQGLRMPFVGDPSGRGYMNAHHGCLLRAVLPPEMLGKGETSG